MKAERTEYLKSFDGADLFFRCRAPGANGTNGEKIAGLVVAVHGFGEHSGRYAHVAEFLVEREIAFASFDLRGHGRSGKSRGDAENLQSLILDVLYVVNHALRILGFGHRKDNFFFGILGHSYGGLLVSYAASILGESCPPLFLSSPCYEVKAKPPKWKEWAASHLTPIFPELRVPLGIQPDVISMNPENNARYLADPLNLKEITSRYGKIFLDSLNPTQINSAVSQIRVPTKICYGGSDRLVNSNRTEVVAGLFPQHLMNLVKIDGSGHEIFNERGTLQERAFQELGSWLAR